MAMPMTVMEAHRVLVAEMDADGYPTMAIAERVGISVERVGQILDWLDAHPGGEVVPLPARTTQPDPEPTKSNPEPVKASPEPVKPAERPAAQSVIEAAVSGEVASITPRQRVYPHHPSTGLHKEFGFCQVCATNAEGRQLFPSIDRRFPLERACDELRDSLREFGDPRTVRLVVKFCDEWAERLRANAGIDYSPEALAFGRVATELARASERARGGPRS